MWESQTYCGTYSADCWEVVHKLLLPQKSLGSSSSQTTFHLLQKLKKQMYDWEGGSITSQTNHTIHSVEVCHFLASLKKRPMKITSLQQLFSAIIFPPMTHCSGSNMYKHMIYQKLKRDHMEDLSNPILARQARMWFLCCEY